MPDALTLWSLAVLVIGGLIYAAMSMSTKSTSTSVVRSVRRPGWIARRRARGRFTLTCLPFADLQDRSPARAAPS